MLSDTTLFGSHDEGDATADLRFGAFDDTECSVAAWTRRLGQPEHKEFNSLLLRGRYSGNAKLIGFWDEILPRKDHLWTFLDLEGIELTNNAAERALRSAVILRKLSLGTQSSGGTRYIERILSISETFRLQKRNAYE